MKEVRVRKIPDEDYAWLKKQASDDGMMLETWLRRYFRDLRLAPKPIVKSNEIRIPVRWETLK